MFEIVHEQGVPAWGRYDSLGGCESLRITFLGKILVLRSSERDERREKERDRERTSVDSIRIVNNRKLIE